MPEEQKKDNAAIREKLKKKNILHLIISGGEARR